MKTISIKNDIVPMAEFKTGIAKWFRSIQNTGHPLIITQNGKPTGVLLSPADYDDLVYKKTFLDSVGRGIADANNGKTFSTKELKRDVVCIIPSRYESSRFPGKPLANLCGKPMIQHVYERVARAKAIPYVAVATDDERIFNAVRKFGGNAVMTAATHRSGTDRIAEAVAALNLAPEAIVVNIQGDQPIFEPMQVDEVIAPLQADPAINMSTLIYKIIRDEEITHPHAVKVVLNAQNFALYFSRATIPYVRSSSMKADYYKHHGIYAYRRDFLDIFTKLPEGKLEKLEALEQLRALEYGYKIKAVITPYDSVEVDNEEELERVRQILTGSVKSEETAV